MKKLLLAVLLLSGTCLSPVLAQQGKTSGKDDRAQVMLLGTFHFAYPNLDMVKTEKPNSWI
jgi:hypothetical protein